MRSDISQLLSQIQTVLMCFCRISEAITLEVNKPGQRNIKYELIDRLEKALFCQSMGILRMVSHPEIQCDVVKHK